MRKLLLLLAVVVVGKQCEAYTEYGVTIRDENSEMYSRSLEVSDPPLQTVFANGFCFSLCLLSAMLALSTSTCTSRYSAPCITAVPERDLFHINCAILQSVLVTLSLSTVHHVVGLLYQTCCTRTRCCCMHVVTLQCVQQYLQQ